MDVLLSTGEQISCALLAGALIKLGINARSWLNWQIPIPHQWTTYKCKEYKI